MRKRRNSIETNIQVAIGQFLDVALPPGSFWCHVPNGGWRSKSEGGRFKAMGVKRGVSDLMILSPEPAYGGRPITIWIEVKRPGEKMTDEQFDFQTTVAALGCPVAMVSSPEEVEEFLLRLGVPLRASFTIEGAKDARGHKDG